MVPSRLDVVPWRWRALGAAAVLVGVAAGAAAYDATVLRGSDAHDHAAMGHETHHEPAPWLALVEWGAASSAVGDGHGHGGGSEAGAHGDRASVVGLIPYEGPRDAQAILDLCWSDLGPCLTSTLKDLLVAEGSEAAFTKLDELAQLNPEVKWRDHTIAHELGRHAFLAYGTIDGTLATCSYKVFQGCLHGALQAYLEGVPLEEARLRGLCPSDNAFREYACLHGVGHGLMLSSGFNLTSSLAACGQLDEGADENNCQGGAYMENVVSYKHSRDARSSADAHGHDLANVTFAADPARPYYPCDVAPDDAKRSCWRMQTSLILYHNGFDYPDAARTCLGAPAEFVPICFNSLGRDAAPRMHDDVPRAADLCALGDEEARGACVRGFIATIILDHADPGAALPVCPQFPPGDRWECWDRTGDLGSAMVGEAEMDALCGQVEALYRTTCRTAAGLES